MSPDSLEQCARVSKNIRALKQELGDLDTLFAHYGTDVDVLGFLAWERAKERLPYASERLVEEAAPLFLYGCLFGLALSRDIETAEEARPAEGT